MTQAARILDPLAETADDLWPAQRAAIRQLVTRLRLPIDPADVRTEDDLARLPFTTKADLHSDPPLAGMGVSPESLVRIHASSGTTGTRTLSAYTAADLDLWTRMVARGLAALGVDETSLVYSTLAHGLFTGGFGFHQAATHLGATVVPGGQAPSRTHADLIRRLRPSVLCSTPSYAQHLIDRHGPLPPIAIGVFGAEPWSEADRRRLEQTGQMIARDTYGLSEVIGPGVAFECLHADGMHVNADHFIPEIIDADGQPVADGEWGELVLSAPTRQARPLLRYRTGDRTRLDRSPCRCGRTLPRISRVSGRIDDMVVVRGVNLRPSDVAEALARFEAPLGQWRLELTRPGALDVITLVVESRCATDPDHAIQLARHLRSRLGLRIEVQTIPLGSSDHSGGKASRWRDLRRSGGESSPENE